MPPPIGPRRPVPASQWDRVYGNGDGKLSIDERGVALTTESVLAKHPMAVWVKTDLDRHPVNAFRAGATYRDEFGAVNVRIYPGAVGMQPELVPYVVGHELGHVALSHLDRANPGVKEELEADWFAGRTLHDFGEDVEEVIRVMIANSGDSASHGALQQRIDAIRGGYNEARQQAANVTTPTPRPVVVARPSPARDLQDAADAFVDAFRDFVNATRRPR